MARFCTLAPAWQAQGGPPTVVGRSGLEMVPLTHLRAWTAGVLLLAGCVTQTATTAAHPEAIAPSHLYAHPLDDVLQQAQALLVEKGWKVQRSGDELATNWVHVETPAPRSEDGPLAPIATSAPKPADVIGYRVYGERIDDGYCSIRIVRLVATSSNLYFGEKKGGHVVTFTSGGPNPTAVHHGSSYAFENSDAFLNENFQDVSAESAVREDAPSGLVVNYYQRDVPLELAIQDRIDPPFLALATPAPAVARPTGAPADAGVAAIPQARPVASGHPTALGGIWDGVFTFNGFVSGSYSGEIAIAVDGDSAEVGDFCPEGGGTLSASGSGNSASWQGELRCPSIAVQGCRSAVLTYSLVTATLDGSTLTVAAAGTVAVPANCGDTSGPLPLTVTFVAHKADYLHLAIYRTSNRAACVWPRDWEDLSSPGSMAMPEPPADAAAYLGVIRARGERRTDIQRLLRHCRHLVLLRGQPVLMKVAGNTPGPK